MPRILPALAKLSDSKHLGTFIICGFTFAQSIASCGFTFAQSIASSRDSRVQFKAIEARLTPIEARLTTIEARLAGVEAFVRLQSLHTVTQDQMKGFV